MDLNYNDIKKKVNSKKKSGSTEEKIYNVIVYIVFSLLMLICAYPFYYLMICTISNSQAVDLGQVVLHPIGLNIDNYRKVFSIQNLANSAFVSVLRVLVGTTGTVLVCSYMAYFFTKEKMWGRKVCYRLVVVTMYFSAGMIPGYLNCKMLGLLNSFWIYILPGLVSAYNLILIKTSIEAMPAELEESAYLDGAGYFVRLYRIVLPLQKPILATVGLFVAVAHWNDFFTTKLYITSTKLYTLQFQLYELLNQVRAVADQTGGMGVDRYNVVTANGIRMTLTAVVVIPIMLVYPFIQKYYVKGVMIGAVKG